MGFRLAPLAATADHRPALVNARTGGVVARSVEMADDRAARRRGLLGRDGSAFSDRYHAESLRCRRLP